MTSPLAPMWVRAYAKTGANARKHYREPCEQQVPTHYHQVIVATERKY
jgi:hypothetical protein